MMGSAIKQAIQDQIKQAMIAREKDKLETLRFVMAELKQVEIDERLELDDVRVLDMLAKMVKKRKDAIETFSSGQRMDLVEKEERELAFIVAFLPAPLTDAEVNALLAQAITNVGAKGIADMGKVMNELRSQCNGRYDMSKLSAQVKRALTAC